MTTFVIFFMLVFYVVGIHVGRNWDKYTKE